MTEESGLDRDLDRMAGSPAMAKIVKKQIEALGDGAAGAQLAEMARDLLDGRTGLRDIAQSDAYAEPLTEATAKYQSWYDSLDAEQRRELLAETRRRLNDEAGPTPGA